jgi:hypothetical protein
MTIEISEFSVTANKHPESTNDKIAWLVFIRVKFKSDDPVNWGELRAYGGTWVQQTRITKAKPSKRKELTSQVLAPKDTNFDSDKEYMDVKENAIRSLPPWPGYRPTSNPDLKEQDLRLGNDQHIEIFYAKKVQHVPRSDASNKQDLPEPKYIEYDPMIDTMSYDDVNEAVRSNEIDTNCHIFGRDEPEISNILKSGYYCEYYHAAEFHIRPPLKTNVLAKKKLLLIVQGEYGKLEYKPPIIN